MEDREGDLRAEAVELVGPFKQAAGVEGFRADGACQIELRPEVGLGGLFPGYLRCQLHFSRADVRALTQRVGRYAYHHAGVDLWNRPRILQHLLERAWHQAGEDRKAVLDLLDAGLDGRNGGVGLLQHVFRLVERQRIREAGLVAGLHKRVGLLLKGQVVLRDRKAFLQCAQ